MNAGAQHFRYTILVVGSLCVVAAGGWLVKRTFFRPAKTVTYEKQPFLGHVEILSIEGTEVKRSADLVPRQTPPLVVGPDAQLAVEGKFVAATHNSSRATVYVILDTKRGPLIMQTGTGNLEAAGADTWKYRAELTAPTRRGTYTVEVFIEKDSYVGRATLIVK